MTMDGLGCKSREDADKILHMVAAQDHEAFRQFQILHLPTRDCRWFKKGQRLYVEEIASSDSTCMRALGLIETGWHLRFCGRTSIHLRASTPDGQAAHQRRGAADRGDHCETARTFKPPPDVASAITQGTSIAATAEKNGPDKVCRGQVAGLCEIRLAGWSRYEIILDNSATVGSLPLGVIQLTITGIPCDSCLVS